VAPRPARPSIVLAIASGFCTSPIR
jgi:hypothetical protein